MNFRHLLLPMACIATHVHTLSFSSLDLSSISPPSLNILKRQATCPPVWREVSAELTEAFLSDGQCNDLARAVLRLGFHDQGTFSLSATFTAPAGGGADGSLLLNDDEMTRIENDNEPIKTARSFLLSLRSKHPAIGAADLVAFASHAAVATCPGGPPVRTLVGRRDSTAAAAPFLLPPGFGRGSSHDAILALFADKGFGAAELAALVGAHSVARAFDQAPLPRGAALDSTPGRFDARYYDEMLAEPQPEGVFRLDSDRNLAAPGSTVGEQFKLFAGDQARFRERFADAMFKLSVLGIPQEDVDGFVDCTGALPVGSAKRDMRAAAIGARA